MDMKNRLKGIITLAVAACTLASCTKGFENLNKDQLVSPTTSWHRTAWPWAACCSSWNAL